MVMAAEKCQLPRFCAPYPSSVSSPYHNLIAPRKDVRVQAGFGRSMNWGTDGARWLKPVSDASACNRGLAFHEEASRWRCSDAAAAEAFRASLRDEGGSRSRQR